MVDCTSKYDAFARNGIIGAPLFFPGYSTVTVTSTVLVFTFFLGKAEENKSLGYFVKIRGAIFLQKLASHMTHDSG